MLQKNIIYPCSANLEQYISICNTFKLPNKNLDIKFSGKSQTGLILSVKIQSIVKPAHEVTSINQSPVLKGHLFLVLS